MASRIDITLPAQGTPMLSVELRDNFEAARDDIEDLQLELGDLNAGVDTKFDIVHDRIDGVLNLGHYAGAFDSHGSLPTSTSSFSRGISVNDFVTVRSDENYDGAATRYVVSDISGGAITWSFDVRYSTDISGKMDLVSGAVPGNLPTFDSQGQVRDHGYPVTQLIDNALYAKIPSGTQPGQILMWSGTGWGLFNLPATMQPDPSSAATHFDDGMTIWDDGWTVFDQ